MSLKYELSSEQRDGAAGERFRPSLRPPAAYVALDVRYDYHKVLVRIHFIIVMIGWSGLAPWKFEFPFPGSLTSTFLVSPVHAGQMANHAAQGREARF